MLGARAGPGKKTAMLRPMRRIAAIALALAACGHDPPSARDDCRIRKSLFLDRVTMAFAGVIARAPADQRDATRAFVDRTFAYARAHFDAYCDAVSDEEWACMNDVTTFGAKPGPGCYAALSHFGKAVFDDDSPPFP